MSRGLIARCALRGSAAILLLLGHAASAATVDETLKIDLAPLIDQAAQSPERFAVDIPHAVSVAQSGTWTSAAATSTWTYSIRIPTAVSMSLHASRANLPPGAVLTITGSGGTKASYTARDIARSGLWTRPTPGDTVFLSMSVPNAQRSQVVLRIASFQAGYRGLGGAVPDHPEYLRIVPRLRQQTSGCTENYSCDVTSANQGPGGATVAIVVANVGQCTGTLLNDTSGDGIPYVLTARHCENGTLGGGFPAAAESVTVYWDAVSPCGATLGTIYDSNAITQTGATTIVEQQDAWLIRLDAPPAASDAYYAGWDATGGVFAGGYSIHHALGFDKQYVEWNGQAILQSIPGATLNIGYTSNFWGVVNAIGSTGAGASGGALFDPSNHVVGSDTLGEHVNGPNSGGVCPANPPPVPSPATITNSYTALSAVWSSTSDTTSTTGATTLQSVLDAAGTGKLVLDGIASLPISFATNQATAQTGQAVSLTWNAPGAQSCVASGGLNGDGWGGPTGASGTVALTEQTGGEVTYTIRCTAATQVGFAFLTVNWQLVPAVVQLTGPGPVAAAGREVLLQWSANTQPCTASGGISGDGWAGTKASNGSQNVLASVLGSVTYTITCGTGARTATNQYTITVVAPSVSTINNDANDMLVGQPVNLEFLGGGSCVASGGAPGDGWAGPLATSSGNSGPLGYTLSATEAVAGTYTYTVTCSGAGATANLSATSSVTLTFKNSPPTVSVSVSPASAEVYGDPAAAGNDVVNLSWTSNVRPCGISTLGPGNVQIPGPSGPGLLPSETIGEGEAVAGLYTYTVTCGTGANQAQGTASATYFTNAPSAVLHFPNIMAVGGPATVEWDTNLYPCTATGGQSGDGWSGGPKAAAAFGVANQTVTESAAGTVTFGITCGSGAQTAQAQATVSVIVPQVSITASASTLPVNSLVDITWSSNVGTCTSTITPGGPGSWGNIQQPSGSFEGTELVAGTYTYTIDCAGVLASTQVTFTGTLMTLTASASSAVVDTPVTLSWSSPPGTTDCTAGGGSAGDGWTGELAPTGTQGVTETTASTVSYSISCTFYGTVKAQTQVTYTPVTAVEPSVPTPSVTLNASAASQVEGSRVMLTWSSQNASACTASGGGNGDGWNGTLSLSGTMSVTESTTGSFTYNIMCTGAPPAAAATTAVDFTDAVTVTGSGSTGGGKTGGGGALDLGTLLLLVLSLSYRTRHAVWGRSSGRRGYNSLER